jgi:phage terminase large subunit
MRYGGIRILILRRTYPELEENHIRILRAELKGIAKYSDKNKVFEFPNGSAIKLGYCGGENDVLQYQGQEYDLIFIDEATQFTEFQYATLTACVRGANSFPKRMYLTCNPGGVGHEWVKRLFISRRFSETENPDDYCFIGATTKDNRVLMEADPGYIKMLDNLPDGLREAWRDGNWDMLAGRYFSEFDRSVHVVEPFAVPEHWLRYRAVDYGLDCAACVWVAVSELGEYYVYREYAVADRIIADAAADITGLSDGERIEYTVAPSDLWARSQESAKSKADLFREGGLYLLKGNNNREAGWLAVKDLLAVKNGGARLKIFKNCVNLIECLPALQRNLKKPTDCMTEPHDITHLPDALRYLVLQFISPAKEPVKEMSAIARHEEKLLRQIKRRRSYL